MLFCPDCGGLLKRKKKGDKKILVCKSCGAEFEGKAKIKKEKNKKKKEINVVEKEEETMPTVEKECPKCGNEKAFFWTLQTRASDEPATKFFKCTKCGYTWRVY